MNRQQAIFVAEGGPYITLHYITVQDRTVQYIRRGSDVLKSADLPKRRRLSPLYRLTTIISTCLHIHMCCNIHVCVYIYIYIYTRYTCIHIYIYIYMYLSLSLYIYIYIDSIDSIAEAPTRRIAIGVFHRWNRNHRPQPQTFSKLISNDI